jgi:2-dehydropantoate 2-reductase
MKIYVIGTGGVGGFYGGLLAGHGCDVTFVARGDHYAAIAKNGLEVKSVVGDFTIHPAKVISSIAEIEVPDLVLITVKTYDTEEVCKQLSQIVNKDTIVMSLQNGVDNDEHIKRHIKNAIVVPGCVYIGAEKAAPGLIVQTGGPMKLVFGSKDKSIESRLLAVEKLMKDAQLDVTYAKDIDKGLWTKFLFIIPFAGMTSICRSPIGAIVNDPGTYALFKRCLSESLQVAQKLGIDVGERECTKIIERCEGYRHTEMGAKSSMLVDIENGRQTEIETLNGKVCQLAAQVGMDVPVNEVIYNSIRLYNRSLSNNRAMDKDNQTSPALCS